MPEKHLMHECDKVEMLAQCNQLHFAAKKIEDILYPPEPEPEYYPNSPITIHQYLETIAGLRKLYPDLIGEMHTTVCPDEGILENHEFMLTTWDHVGHSPETVHALSTLIQEEMNSLPNWKNDQAERHGDHLCAVWLYRE